MAQITLLTTSTVDSAITFALDGVIYEYTFKNPDLVRKCTVINKVSGAQALNYAKRYAYAVKKVEHGSATN